MCRWQIPVTFEQNGHVLPTITIHPLEGPLHFTSSIANVCSLPQHPSKSKLAKGAHRIRHPDAHTDLQPVVATWHLHTPYAWRPSLISFTPQHHGSQQPCGKHSERQAVRPYQFAQGRQAAGLAGVSACPHSRCLHLQISKIRNEVHKLDACPAVLHLACTTWAHGACQQTHCSASCMLVLAASCLHEQNLQQDMKLQHDEVTTNRGS